jgi:hypothetical protein
MSVIDLLFNSDDVDVMITLPFGKPWTELYDMCCALFSEGCQKVRNKVTFDDLLVVKSKMKQANILCEFETVDFEDTVHFPMTLFVKIVNDSMNDSYLQVLGDAVYRVKFVPQFQRPHKISLGCM